MAGLWHLSHHQLHDLNGRPLVGARATFLASSTTSPITVYQDSSLGAPHPNPVVANGWGVFPPVFLDEADEFYRQRIYNASGVLVPGTDIGIIPIIGPSEGDGGAEVPVDPNSLAQTGDFDWQPRSGSRSGWVRANARTIGSSTSGASERANADTEQLFLHLWATYSDTLCPVNGGRGVSPAADWAANKYIGTPDARGLTAIGLADMGNTDSTRLDGITFAVGDKSTAMSRAGAATNTLARNNLANANISVTITDPGHAHSYTLFNPAYGAAAPGTSSAGFQSGSTTGSQTTGITAAFNLNGNVSQVAVDNLQPSMTGSWYIRL